MKKLGFLTVLLGCTILLLLIGIPKTRLLKKSQELKYRQIKELSHHSSNRWLIKIPKNIKRQDLVLLDPADLQNLARQVKVARWVSQTAKFDSLNHTEAAAILLLKNNKYNYEKIIIKNDGSVFVQKAHQELNLATFSKNYFYNPQLFLLRHTPAIQVRLVKNRLLVKRTSNLRKQIIVGIRKYGRYDLYLINLAATNEHARYDPTVRKVILPLAADLPDSDTKPPVVIAPPRIIETPVVSPAPTASRTPFASHTPATSPTPVLSATPGESIIAPTAQPTATASVSLPISMQELWPSPKSVNRSILRFYDHVQNGVVTKNHMIQRLKLNAVTASVKYLALEDWVMNTNRAYVWASTWYLTIDADGNVTETADAVAQYDDNYVIPQQWLDLRYIKGKEILWGNKFNLGTIAQGTVMIDTNISNIYSYNADGSQRVSAYPAGSRAYGFNTLKYLQPFVNSQLANGTFYSGNLFSLYQTFCGATCVAPNGWEVWVNYYLTPHVGAVRMDYYRRSEGTTAALDQGSHQLSLFCEADRESFACS
jgi:hypothetical protein